MAAAVRRESFCAAGDFAGRRVAVRATGAAAAGDRRVAPVGTAPAAPVLRDAGAAPVAAARERAPVSLFAVARTPARLTFAAAAGPGPGGDRFATAGLPRAPAAGLPFGPARRAPPAAGAFAAPARGAPVVRRRDGVVVDGLFVFAVSAATRSSGRARQTTSSLPMCWTGAASSSAQIRASAVSRVARSPSAQRTLMSSWAVRQVSISFSTAGVRPWWPMITTGSSAWARARSARRSEGVGVFMARFYRARQEPPLGPLHADDVMGELSCTSPFDGWTFADCGIKRTLRSTARMAPAGIVGPIPVRRRRSDCNAGDERAANRPIPNARIAIHFETTATRCRRGANRARATAAALARGFRQPPSPLKFIACRSSDSSPTKRA